VKYEGNGIRIIFEAPIPIPSSGSTSEKASAMTQVMADRFAKHISANTVDWHMLQRIWIEENA
jgi:KDO2-lipid IV(A) lauroyltransferase